MQVIRLGYYNDEGTWFNVNEFNGFDNRDNYPPEDTQLFAVIYDDLNNRDHTLREFPITREQAIFLENMYGTLR